MADEKLSWVFELFDRMSGPAKEMADRLGALDQRLGKAMETLNAFDKRTQSASGSILAMGAGLGGWVTALKEVAGLAARVGGFFASTFFDLGKQAVDGLAFRESTLASFEMMLGTKKAADELFADATSMARTTPFDTTDVVTAYKTLLTAGFSKQEVPIVFQAVGDQAAAMGMKKEIIGQLALVFGQIKAQGRVMGNDLIQLSNAGVGRKNLMEQLAKQTGMTVEGARAALSGGAIGADQAMVAILQVIANKSGGGVIGGGMERQSQTIDGLMSNIRSIPSDLLFAFSKMEDLPGLTAFKGMLSNIITLFDMSGETGKRTLATLERYFNDAFGALFGGLNGPNGMKRMEEGFNKFLTVLDQVWEVIKGVGRGVEAFWKELEPALDSFVPAGTDLSDMETVGVKLGAALEKAGGALGRMSVALINLMDTADRTGFFDIVNYLIGGKSAGKGMVELGGHVAQPGEVAYDPSKDQSKTFGNYLISLVTGGDKSPAAAALGGRNVTVNVPLTVNGNPKPGEVHREVTGAAETAGAAIDRLQLQRGGH